MNFITGKHIPRRTFMQGMGASVALPFLDAMVPAGRSWSTMKETVDPKRLVAIEMVHGSAGATEWGATQHLWSPEKVGRAFDMSQGSLSSLEPFRDYLTIVSNTDCPMAEAFSPQEIGGNHFRNTAVFLTQAHPKQTEGSDVFVGTSMDQMFAQRFGQATPIPSMQLCIENIDQAGGCAYGYTCIYTDTLSWASPADPLPVIRDPRVAFDQLFGAGGSAEQRRQRQRENRSILDWISGSTARFRQQLGLEDRHRLDRYLQDVRELERRILLTEERNTSGEPREIPEAPTGVPDSFREHMETMFDLQAMAFQGDMTRVFSFKLGRDSSARVFPESGSDKPFHPASHHGGKEEEILEFAMINRYHVSMVPYFLEKLKNLEEGDSNLLDKTLLVYGSAMGDSNLHNHKHVPFFVAGGPNVRRRGNLHLKAPEGTPLANVMLTLLHELGLDDLESFGDSSGEFPLSMSGSHVAAEAAG